MPGADCEKDCEFAVLTSGCLDAIEQLARVEECVFVMAWFDKNPGGKRGSDSEAEKGSPEVRASSEPRSVSPAPAPKQETLAKPVDAGLVAHLYKGSRVTGQLSFQGSARIDGSVDGEIRCQGTLTIGEGADVKARISGETVVIRGRVEGNVTANAKVELAAPARLYGNLTAPRLFIAEGVIFDGDCSMGVATNKGGVASAVGVAAEKAGAGQKPQRQADSET
jgi:cytoskeletal protein CcmA (bactofilin family)